MGSQFPVSFSHCFRHFSSCRMPFLNSVASTDLVAWAFLGPKSKFYFFSFGQVFLDFFQELNHFNKLRNLTICIIYIYRKRTLHTVLHVDNQGYNAQG